MQHTRIAVAFARWNFLLLQYVISDISKPIKQCARISKIFARRHLAIAITTSKKNGYYNAKISDQKNLRTIQIRKSFCLKAVKFPKVIDDMTRKEGMPQLSQRNLATNIVEIFIVMNLLTPPPQNICDLSQENERHGETI